MDKPAANAEQIHAVVRAAYGQVARSVGVEGEPSSCCSAPALRISDYTPEELAAVPEGAHLGEGSGAPVRHAGLRPGEVVVDLGAGAGMDSFLAARAVGNAGRVFGFDLTPEMIERARGNAAKAGFDNVSFEQADIAQLPLPAESADAAISNCVINLTPDKRAVFRELFRVLKPVGRLSIADIVLRGASEDVQRLRARADAADWCACVSGALEEPEYLAAVRAAGFVDVHLAAERPAQLQPGGDVQAVAITLIARKPA